MLRFISDFTQSNFWNIWAIIPIIMLSFYFLRSKLPSRTTVLLIGLLIFLFFNLPPAWNIWVMTPMILFNFYFLRSKFPARTMLLLNGFLIFLSFYSISIMYKENFAARAESPLIYSCLTGIELNCIYPGDSRFFPLTGKEFYLIKKLACFPGGCHAISVIQLWMVMVGLFFFLRKWTIGFRLFVMIAIATMPSFVFCFFRLLAGERCLIFWLVALLICLRQYLKTKSSLSLAGSIIATQFALYYKEPVFLFIGGFAGFRLILKMFMEKDFLKQKGFRNFLANHILEVCLLLLSGAFLFIYVCIQLPYPKFVYSDRLAIGVLNVLTESFYSDPLISVFLLAMLLRGFYLIRQKQSPDLFWDALAFGSFLHFAAFLKLQIYQVYYMAPVDFIAVLYLSRYLYSWFQRNNKKFLAGIVLLFLIIGLGRNAAASLSSVLEMKNFVLGKTRLVKFLKDYLENEPSRNANLFFPYSPRRLAGGWSIMEMGAFLEFKGLKISESEKRDDRNGPSISLKWPVKTKDDLCTSYRDTKCFYSEAPSPGDFIVVLPDDDVLPDELLKLQTKATLLFHYQYNFFPLTNKLSSLLFFHKKNNAHLTPSFYLFRSKE